MQSKRRPSGCSLEPRLTGHGPMGLHSGVETQGAGGGTGFPGAIDQAIRGVPLPPRGSFSGRSQITYYRSSAGGGNARQTGRQKGRREEVRTPVDPQEKQRFRGRAKRGQPHEPQRLSRVDRKRLECTYVRIHTSLRMGSTLSWLRTLCERPNECKHFTTLCHLVSPVPSFYTHNQRQTRDKQDNVHTTHGLHTCTDPFTMCVISNSSHPLEFKVASIL